MSEFNTTIGLEIHAQLNTKSKMFCFCDNDSQSKEPNTVICPICLGLPGTLPVTNGEAVKKTIIIGRALDCDIPEFSKFDRKHYYYPDLPKGYQISQYDMPLCKGGEVKFEHEGTENTVVLNRIHLEEDAGKLIHDKKSNNTIVDLNRAGTPLVEIVTEPVIKTPVEAKLFMQALQKILRELKVSSADMEKGHMRCDANISVQKDGKSTKIIEIKNLNSFRFVQKALEYEEKRLSENFQKNLGPGKETRGFNSKKLETFAQRKKEEASDYRYFPEPDIPTIKTSEIEFEDLNFELPQAFKKRLEDDYGLSSQISSKIASSKNLSDLFKDIEKQEGVNAARIANWLANERIFKLDQDLLTKISRLIDESKINNEQAKQIMKSEDPNDLIEKLLTAKPEVNLVSLIGKIVNEYPNEKAKYKSGKTQLMGFFVGLIMKETRGSANPQQIMQYLKKELEK